MTPDQLRQFKKENFSKIFKEQRVPNTSVPMYGKDSIAHFELGGRGKDTFTSHIIQEYDWTSNDYEYTWNSFGWRGPEPNFNSKKRIMFAGGSLILGTGVPVENSMAYITSKQLNSDYINISDYDSLTELIEPISNIGMEYDPQLIVINDTRFITDSGWVLNYFIDKTNHIDKNMRDFYISIMRESNQTILKMFEELLQYKFPHAKIVFLLAKNRKHFKNPPAFKNSITILYEASDIVDLGRDNAHPGIESNKILAGKILDAVQ
jgi:hypothetical protein